MAIDNSKENLVYMNRTKSENGVRIFLDGIEGVPEGHGLTAAMKHIEKFVSGEKDFVAFSRITPSEDEGDE